MSAPTAPTAALVLADGRLPTGGHAHSAGLEAALAAGMAVGDVPAYVLGRLDTVGRVEAAAAVLARRAAATDPAGLALLQAELLARMPSAPLRAASGQLGRGLVRLADRLWPDEPAVAALHTLGEPLRPLALGVVAALAGLDDAQTARTCLYDDVQSVASAASKLLPVDPVEPVAWVLAAAPALEAVVADSVRVGALADLPATSAPLTEQWSLAHHLRSRRIFRA